MPGLSLDDDEVSVVEFVLPDSVSVATFMPDGVEVIQFVPPVEPETTAVLPGPAGPAGSNGADGEDGDGVIPDLPDLTILFQNGLS